MHVGIIQTLYKDTLVNSLIRERGLQLNPVHEYESLHRYCSYSDNGDNLLPRWQHYRAQHYMAQPYMALPVIPTRTRNASHEEAYEEHYNQGTLEHINGDLFPGEARENLARHFLSLHDEGDP